MQQKVGIVGFLLLCGVLVSACAPSAEERRASIYELRADPTEENILEIRELLRDPDRYVRATAMNTLVWLNPPDAEQLALDGLDDPEGFVRAIAAKLLGDLEAVQRAERVASVLLEDPYPRARQTAAETLERFGGETAGRALVRGLDDPMTEVRLAAVKGVRSLEPPGATPSLARLLLEDSEWEIRVQAAGALGQTGDPEVVPVLRAALDDESDFVRAAAINALEELGEPVEGAKEAPGWASPE
jgi:HEAT repeat protein